MYTWEELNQLYNFRGQARLNLEPRYNISPATNIDIVLPADDGHKLERARWGLVPIWWKKGLKELPSTIDARAETVAEKPMFRSAYKARRCSRQGDCKSQLFKHHTCAVNLPARSAISTFGRTTSEISVS
jgi:putative SOS response-associated peptidase YedK